MRGYGVRGFLVAADVLPGAARYVAVDGAGAWQGAASGGNVAVAFHLTMPALPVLDRAKTRLQVPHEVEEAVEPGAVALRQDPSPGGGGQRERDAVKAQRRREREEDKRRREEARRAREEEAELKGGGAPRAEARQAAPLKECIRQAGRGGVPAGLRGRAVGRLQPRPLLRPAPAPEAVRPRPTDLEFNYFSAQIGLLRLEPGAPALRRLYYDARGKLYEPHTGREIELGTREVQAYAFPPHLYNKILYIEKKGVWDALKPAGLAEKYDMAVIAAEGYATEAVRSLLQRADKQKQYTIFVFHDADPHGYNIARTLAEETDRMPGYRVKVLDLGLRLEEAVGSPRWGWGSSGRSSPARSRTPRGWCSPPWRRSGSAGCRSRRGTSGADRRPTGRRGGSRSTPCSRCPPAPPTSTARSRRPCGGWASSAGSRRRSGREAGLPPLPVEATATGAGKVLPPAGTLAAQARAAAESELATWVRSAVERRLDLNAVVDDLTRRWQREGFVARAVKPRRPVRWVEKAFEHDPRRGWQAALEGTARRSMRAHLEAHEASLEEAITGALREQLEGIKGEEGATG